MQHMDDGKVVASCCNSPEDMERVGRTWRSCSVYLPVTLTYKIRNMN